MLNIYLSMLDSPEEKDKFEELYLQYHRLMKYVSNQILRDEQLAEDAVHIAFMRIIDNFHKIGKINCHKTKNFCIIVVENISKRMYTTRKKENSVSFDEVEFEIKDNFKTDEKVIEKLDEREIAEKIGKLSPIYRDVLMLKIFYELADKEISEILGIKNSAVRKRIERAKIMLKKILQEEESANEGICIF